MADIRGMPTYPNFAAIQAGQFSSVNVRIPTAGKRMMVILSYTAFKIASMNISERWVLEMKNQ
jgi:hypothetical protein